ncbi:MAG: SurA N-terminal domain-containing protein [Thermodesulfobacteriota bacterium]
MLELIRQRAQSWGVRILFGLIIVVFVLYFGTGTMRQAGKSSAVAYVGEHPISGQDFDLAVKQAYENLRRQSPDMSREDLQRIHFREQVLNQMINTLLLEQEAARLGLAVTPDEVRTAIAGVSAFQADKRFNPDRYKAVLREAQTTPGEYEADMARQLLVEKVKRTLNLAVTVAEPEARAAFNFAREQLRLDTLLFGWEEFAAAVKPAEDEIKGFYEANQERFKVPARVNLETVAVTPKALARPDEVSEADVAQYYAAHEKSFAQPEAAKLRHILARVEEGAPAAEVEKARERVLKLRLRLDKGEDFAAVAKDGSDDPSSAQGGELGWIPRGTTVPAFEEAAFALKPGQVSMPVRSPFGWHLIRCEDKRAEGVKTLAEAAAEIRATLAEERAASRVAEVLDEALERTLAGEDLRKVAGGLNLQVAATGLVPEPAIVQALDLKPEDAARLSTLGLGQTLDAPLPVADGYLLVRKAEAQPAAVKPLDEVREAVSEAVKRQGALKLARERAQAALAEIAAPEGASALLKLKDRLSTTDPVGRQGFIKGLGLNPNLVEDAYNAADGSWLGQAYPVQNGFALVRLKERISPSQAEWDSEKQTWLAALRQAKERELFQAYLTDLRKQAKVNVLVDPATLD